MEIAHLQAVSFIKFFEILTHLLKEMCMTLLLQVVLLLSPVPFCLLSCQMALLLGNEVVENQKHNRY